ncbi:hypothetical protein Bbelb_250610 [Branchiostoma belcheri]|nr:hypothetical protein Bbelb_250610 [Branchiostoma belcheri]
MMEGKNRHFVAVLFLMVLKLSLPCPDECFVHHEWVFVRRKICSCPSQRDAALSTPCIISRDRRLVAAGTVCSEANHGLTCLNTVPTGFDDSVTGIVLNRLFNITTLTKHHIPPLPNLGALIIATSTIQAIEEDAFSPVPSIQSIAIRCSRLRHIGDFSFHNLPALSSIFLDHNIIHTVSPKAFTGLTSLTKICLKGNQLKAVPYEVIFAIIRSKTVVPLQVNLINNQIGTVLEAGWNNISAPGVSLLLKGNPFVCDGRMRWLVCNPSTSARGTVGTFLTHWGRYLRCTSPSELAGRSFVSLHTHPYCSCEVPTTAQSPMVVTSIMTSTFPTAKPITLPGKSFGTTNSTMTQQSRKTPSDTVGLVETNLDDGQRARTANLYIAIGLTVAFIALVAGALVVVVMYKRRALIQNPVQGRHGVIISSQLIRNQMYQPSGSAATGGARDKEESDKAEGDLARQDPAHKRQQEVNISSQLIRNQMYQPSGSAVTGGARDKEESGGAESDSARQDPAHKRQGVNIDQSQLISNRMYKSSASAANNANKGTEPTELNKENPEMISPYLTVPLDAIDNSLRIEPYSSVNLEDIREDMSDCVPGNREVQEEENLEPYACTPLDQIGD